MAARAARAASVFRWGSFYPTHCIVAVVPERERADRAVAELLEAGFAADDVTSVTGEEARANDQTYMDNRNLLERAQGMFPSEEEAIVRTYLAEAERGAGFVVVRAPERGRREDAHRILKANGGDTMRYYGDNAITDLG